MSSTDSPASAGNADTAASSFSMGARSLNSGPQACMAALTSEAISLSPVTGT